MSLDFRFFFAYNNHMGEAAKRPEILSGCTYRVPSAYGTLFMTLNEDDSGCPYEVFLKAGKSGSDLAAHAEAIARLCTLLLQIHSNLSARQRIENIVTELSEIGGRSSIPNAVAFALNRYLSEK